MPWWVIDNTLLAALFALVVAAASRATRVRPVVRHGLWLIVLVKLVTPPLFSLPLPHPAAWPAIRPPHQAVLDAAPTRAVDPLHAPSAADPVSPAPGLRGPLDAAGPIAVLSALELVDMAEEPMPADRPLEAALPGPETFDSSNESDVIDELPAPFDPNGTSKARHRDALMRPDGPQVQATMTNAWGRESVSLTAWLLGAALSGSVVITLVQLVRLVRLHRLLKRSRAAPDDFVALVREMARELGIATPAVRISPEVPSPLVCALGRAVLVWPETRLGSLTGAGQRAVVVHELAHLARRDHWVGWLELGASCGWWWNPLFWYVRHQLRENAELACDAWVTGLFPEGKRAYARALVDLAECDSCRRACAPAFGFGGGSRNFFERRLVMIMNADVRYRMGALGIIGTGLMALAALPGCSAGQAGEESALASDPPFESVVDEFESAAATDPLDERAGGSAAPDLSPDELPAPSGPAAIEPIENLASPPAGNASLDRLDRLESKVDALIAELRQTRPVPATAFVPSSRSDSIVPASSPVRTPGRAGHAPLKLPQASAGAVSIRSPGTKPKPAIADRADEGVEAVALFRRTYKMPAGKAEAVAAFLEENLTDEIEVRVKGEGLQVTASREDQTAISQFIRLLTTRGSVDPKPSSQRTEMHNPIPPHDPNVQSELGPFDVGFPVVTPPGSSR